jgi:uncharacterized membrane protein
MKKKTIIILLIAIAVIWVGVGTITGNATKDSGGSLEIPISEISGDAKWYEYDSDGTKIQFFAVKASDGTIRTAFDACDICYGSKKGYRQEGDVMVCNNCGNKYPIDGLGTENVKGGGCWPGYLPSKIEGDSLIVKHSDLEKGAYRF